MQIEAVGFSNPSSVVGGASEAIRLAKEEVKRVYSSFELLRTDTWRENPWVRGK